MMFSGLMSRWTMPAVCAAASALATWRATSIGRGRAHGLFEKLPERGALHELLHDEVARGLHFAGVVNRHDVGVIQRGGGARFPQEAIDRVGLPERGGGQELDRHRAVQPIVPGAVHLSHAPPPEHGIDPIWPYVATQHGQKFSSTFT